MTAPARPPRPGRGQQTVLHPDGSRTHHPSGSSTVALSATAPSAFAAPQKG
ncbi:hypothetical protein [Streptomyces atratus]|uniref:hypothetical protein n=1 Tax=Streptomyces atratus TaxID=1893 RepID=UPI0037B9CA79